MHMRIQCSLSIKGNNNCQRKINYMIRKLRKLNDEKKHHTKIGKRKQELKKGTRSAFAMSICSLILVSSGSLDSGIYVLGSSMSFSCSKEM